MSWLGRSIQKLLGIGIDQGDCLFPLEQQNNIQIKCRHFEPVPIS